jgi:hypothetical protein
MLTELWADLQDMWRKAVPLERGLFIVIAPIYTLAFVLAYLFGEE